ncbi:hypothetical protein AAFF_G00368150 [Aldrovandia affinis]|uniref:Uncharacterized protein n=1 Tax=Aldrovandia affinis TaxID=143900 RepID=A0AAD7WMA8_9TELE|nr:hypothetical protein AAFF_G00368150 [Aldrovandia affinis]
MKPAVCRFAPPPRPRVEVFVRSVSPEGTLFSPIVARRNGGPSEGHGESPAFGARAARRIPPREAGSDSRKWAKGRPPHGEPERPPSGKEAAEQTYALIPRSAASKNNAASLPVTPLYTKERNLQYQCPCAFLWAECE